MFSSFCLTCQAVLTVTGRTPDRGGTADEQVSAQNPHSSFWKVKKLSGKYFIAESSYPGLSTTSSIYSSASILLVYSVFATFPSQSI